MYSQYSQSQYSQLPCAVRDVLRVSRMLGRGLTNDVQCEVRDNRCTVRAARCRRVVVCGGVWWGVVGCGGVWWGGGV